MKHIYTMSHVTPAVPVCTYISLVLNWHNILLNNI